jgi:uncharacterized membrane protein YfcA
MLEVGRDASVAHAEGNGMGLTAFGLWTLTGLSAAVFVTSLVSGVFGMAGGLMLLSLLLGAGLSVPVGMAIHGIAQAAANSWRALLWYRFVELRMLGIYSLGATITILVFLQLDVVFDKAVVLILLGLIPFAVYVLPTKSVPQIDTVHGAVICGIVNLVVALTAGVSGPLLDVFFLRTELDRRRIVATKAACQIISNIAKTLYFAQFVAASSFVTLDLALLVVAMAFLGTLSGRFVLERMTDGAFQRWTRRIVLAVGVLCIVMGVQDLARRP